MSEAQYDAFLAKQLIEWLSTRIVVGQRYQFRSPDSGNTLPMISHLHSSSAGTIDVQGTQIPYLDVAGRRLLCVAHADAADAIAGFNENYISMLRDRVAEQSDVFANTSLLIIHNSLLDTLVNSAIDLAGANAPWSIASIRASLLKIAGSCAKSKMVFECLLEWQAALISDEGGSVFGFRRIFNSLAQKEELDLRPLGLFNDSGLPDMDKPAQIKKRLEDNRRLHDEFERVAHHFPDEIAERLGVSESFQKRHFGESSDVLWPDLDLKTIKAELAAQENNELEFLSVSSESCILVGPRSQSETVAGKRRKSLILVAKPGFETVDLTIEFIGDDLDEKHIKIEHNKGVAGKSRTEIKRTKNRRRVLLAMPISDSPEMFRLRLDRSQTSERFEFSILVFKKDQFFYEGFENTFLINTHEDITQQYILLQTEERELRINPSVTARWTLTENDQAVSQDEFGLVAYDTMYEESDLVSFEVTSQGHSLKFNVEGEISQESLTLPLLMDEGRFNRLFDDRYNGTFLRDKQRVLIDNKETLVIASRYKMLDVEQSFVNDNLLCFGDDGSSCTAGSLRDASPDLFEAWSRLNGYFVAKATVPSLASWGPEMIDLSGAYVAAYQKFLQGIELGKSLDNTVRHVMRLGTETFDNRHYLTPFHPLVLSYFRHLAIEITRDEEHRSFRNIPSVTRRRLNARGLLPYVYSANHEYCYTQAVEENAYWLEVVPQAISDSEYVSRLTREKIDEFVSTFQELFKEGTNAPLLINSVNNADNREVFCGILEYFRDNGRESEKIHVNLYDDELNETEFDRFAELGTYAMIKKQYQLDKGKAKENADAIIDLLRSRLTFSKFRIGHVETQAYAHLTLFRNIQKVERVSININNHISGVACDGLLNGEASCSENQNYYTGFGLKNVDTSELPHLELARLVGTLQQPLVATNETYNESSAIRLAVSDTFREQLERSYESSLWVTIIDPKVTLKFFEKTKDVVLIHFSDQYTSSAGYDAITATKQTALYRELMRHGSDDAIGEFNAFNGEWLLKMVTAKPNVRKEREGIVGAWKLMSALVSKSDITWVPLSVAEMIRISGNIGLRMSDGDFARYHKDKTNSGRMSDDVLFAGFKEGNLYLIPVEVKTGSGDFKKAHEQVKNVREYFVKRLFGPRTLEGKLYRSLLMRQMFMQIEKYELYEVFPKDYFAVLHDKREDWLRGEFQIAELDNYPEGFVIGHLDSEACFETTCSDSEGVATLKIPISYLESLLTTPRGKLDERIHADNYVNIPNRYFLGRGDAGVVDKQPTPPTDGSPASGIEPFHKTPAQDRRPVADDESKVPTVKPPVASPKTMLIEFGIDVKTRESVFWEPTNTEKVLNPNTAIIGTMGTGKTQFTKSLITQLIHNQAGNVDGRRIGVLVLDYKADYVKPDFVQATNAKVLHLHKLPFNPFALFGDKPMLPMHTASQFRTTIATAYGLGNKQQNRINSLVMDAYESAGINKTDPLTWSKPAPTINDVWIAYNNQDKVEEDSLYAALAELVNFEIFEPDGEKTQSLYDMVDGVTVINLSGYDQTIQNLVVAITLDLFYAQMHQKGSSKIEGPYRQLTNFVLVDEADNFMKQEFPGLRKLLKEGREFGVGTILSTQELTHFKTANNDYSGYILSWIIHRVASIKTQDVKSLFNAVAKDDIDSLMNGIRELEKHQSIYVDGEKHIKKIRDLAFWELANGRRKSGD